MTASAEQTRTRTRTIAWEDPVAAFERGRELSGIDYLHAIRDGELPPPPIAALMGFGLVEVEEGRVVFAVEPAEYHYNPIGLVHGGVSATLLDSVMGCAVQSLLPAGVGYTTLELKVNYVRPMTRDSGRALAEATILYRGSRVATAEGRVFSEETGKLIAHATSTSMIFGG